MRIRTIAFSMLAATALAAGCSSSDTTATDGTTTTAGSSGTTGGTTAGTTAGTIAEGTAPDGAFEVFAQGSPYGDILVDGESRTLYAFTKDVAGQPSACTGSCVDAWPAAKATKVVPGTSVEELASGAVEASVLGVTDDGQVTAGGHRLYYFAGDEAPGDSNGNGTGDVWFVVAPDGTPITAKA